jgi:hypothetical protein
MIVTRHLLKLLPTLVLVISAWGILLHANKAEAVTAGNWSAGRIIDDSVFADKSSMSVAEIQAFLNSKVGTGGYDSIPGQCDTNGLRSAQPFSSSSRTAYGASRTPPNPKFTCLINYYEVPKTSPGLGTPASNYGGAAIPAGAKSAAQLIWDAAQAYNISPKVLLVTIQKESAGPLTIDDWPFKKQFTYAMGAYCPDNPPPEWPDGCDPNYAGFSIQIRESARLFRYYLDNMNQPWWTHKKPGNNSILYNPNTACGASNVYIETSATAALYTYTPYQPNAAALNDMYGNGDLADPAPPNCSSFGNRNFWRIYNDWFGVTYGNCTFPQNNQGETYRLLQPNTNSYFLTSDPYEVCYATGNLGYIYDGVVFYAKSGVETPVYRLEKNGKYFYTISVAERNNAVSQYGYRLEGLVFYAAADSQAGTLKPVYRLSYPSTGGYLYTMSVDERNAMTGYGFRSEGVAFYVYNDTGSTMNDIFRLSHPTSGYLYTPSVAEKNNAVSQYGFQSEGVAFRTRIGFSEGNLPVYRLTKGRGYLYTTSFGERKQALQLGYRSEGISFFAYPVSNLGATKQIFRLSHPSGNYLYTSSAAERDSAVAHYGYHYEGVVFRTP